MPVGSGGFNGGGAEVGPQDATDSSQAGAFDEFEPRSAKGIPNCFVRKRSSQAGHGSGQRWMGGGGDILLAIGKTGIGGKTGAEFHKISRGAGLNFDGPGSLAGVIQQIRTEGVGSLDNFENRPALVSFRDKFEPIADGAVREGLEESAAEGGGDQEGEGLGHFPGFGQRSEEKG